MSDIAVQIDIATKQAEANVDALVKKLGTLKTAMSDIPKAAGTGTSEATRALLADVSRRNQAREIELRSVEQHAAKLTSLAKAARNAFVTGAIDATAYKSVTDAIVKQQTETYKLTEATKALRLERQRLNLEPAAQITSAARNAVSRQSNLDDAAKVTSVADRIGLRYESQEHLAQLINKLDGQKLAAFEAEMRNASKTGVGFKGMLGETAKAVQFLDGPLGGVAYRLTLLGDLWESSGLQMVGTIAGITAAGAALTKFVTSATQMRVVAGFIKNVTDSTIEYETALRGVLDISARQFTNVEATGKFYGRLVNATKDLGISQKGLLDVTETLAAGFRLNMTNAGEASAAMMQLTQALGSGKLNGDEFRSMAENASVTMRLLAKEILGPSGTIAGLREMSTQGKLTTDILVPAMAAIKNEVVGLAESMPPTIGQAFERLNTAFADLAVNTPEAMVALDAVAYSIVAVAENMDLLVTATFSFGAAAAGLLVVGKLKTLYEAWTVASKAAAVAQAAVAASSTAVAASSVTAVAGLTRLGSTVGLLTKAFWALNTASKASLIGLGIFATLELYDMFSSGADAAETLAEKLQRTSEEANELRVIIGGFESTLGTVGGAAVDWANITIEEIARIAQADKIFTDDFIKNASLRFGAKKAFGEAVIEANESELATKRSELESIKKQQEDLMSSGGGYFAVETLVQKRNELAEKASEQAAAVALLEKNITSAKAEVKVYDDAQAKLTKTMEGTTAASKEANASAEKTRQGTKIFKEQGEEAFKVYQKLQEWKEKNPLSETATADDKATYEKLVKTTEAAILNNVRAEAEREKVMQGSAKAAKSLTSETQKQAEALKKVDIYASNQLNQMQATLEDTRLYNDLLEQSGGNIQAATLQYEIQKAQNEYLLDLKKKEVELGKEGLLTKTEEARAALDGIANKAKELELEKQRGERNAELLKKAEELGNSIEKGIADAIYGGFTDGMDDFFESMKDSFLRGIANSMAETLKQGIMPSIQGIFLGGGGGASAGGGLTSAISGGMSLGNVSSLLSAVSSGSLISSAMVDSLNNLGASFGIGSNAIQSQASQLFQAAGMNPTVGTGIGTQIGGLATLGNVAGGFAGNMLGNAVFGDSRYGSIGGTVGGIAGSFFGPVGSAVGSFIGNGIGSMFGPGKPNPASVFRRTAEGDVSYGAKHISDEAAKSTYGVLAQALTSLEALTGQIFSQTEIMGGYDRGSAFYSLGDYKQSGVPIVKFDANDEESGNRAVAKLAAMIAAQNTELSPDIKNALEVIKGSSDNAVASLDAVALALNFEKMGDTPEVVSEVEQAMDALNKKFDDAIKLTKELGLEEAKMEAMRQKALTTLRDTYNTATQSAITGILNPQFAAMQEEKARYDAQMKDAKTIGGNTATVELLHQINNLRIESQYANSEMLDTQKKQLSLAEQTYSLWENLPSSLADSINNLKLSDLSTLSPQEKLLEAQRQFEAVRVAANDNNDPTAAAKLSEAGNTLLQLSKSYYGSTAMYGSTFDSVLGSLETAKSISELQYDISKSALTEAQRQTELLEKLASGGVSGSFANANETLLSLRGRLSSEQFATAEGVIAAATPGVVAGGGRRTSFLGNNAQANAAAVATLRALGIPGFASGGYVSGGMAGFDSVPALLMPGERVLNTSQTKKYDQDNVNSTNEIRAMRQQIAEMQMHMRALVELTAEGNATRMRQTSKMKAAANA